MFKHAEIKIEDINIITINSNPYSNLKNKFLYTVNSKNIFFNINSFLKRQSKKYSIIREIEKFFKRKIKAKLLRYDHHLSHIASSYYLSGFKEATGISIDGFGDFCSLAISRCKGKNIKVLARTFYPNSLGVFYEGITQILGFENYGDEYKVMGLSAYGKPIYQSKLENLINYDEKKLIYLNLNYFLHTKKGFKYTFDGLPKISKLIDKRKFLKLLNISLRDLENIKVKANIASSAQKIYEKIFFRIIDKSLNYNKSRNLVLSGGCVMNCLANGKLIKHKVYKKIFIPYCPGDNGGAIGSALLSYNKKIDLKSFQNPYTGIRSNNENELNNLIKKNKFFFVKFKNYNDLNKKMVQELVKKKIIAILRNNMEFGSRALGNTSIICDPRLSNAKKILNSKIKLREKFRPFAPAILDKSVSKWFEGHIKSPYMYFVLKFRKNKKKLVPAVCHYDETGRIQTVSKNQNPFFYDLIRVFEKN